MLKGAGSVALGIPFLEEMTPRSVAAQSNPPPRLLTTFFPLGLDPSFQKDLTGPLEPYAPLAQRMAMFNNVSAPYAGGGGAHCEVSPVVFVGEAKRGAQNSGGASIEQVVKKQLHPNGPPTPIAQMSTGIWWGRNNCMTGQLRSWNEDGSIAETPLRRPSAVFERLFGAVAPMAGATPDVLSLEEKNARRSVLDTVLLQYNKLRGPASYLGERSKQKIDVHFQRLREVEQQLASIEAGLQQTIGCQLPGKPVDPMPHRPWDDSYNDPIGTVQLDIHQRAFRMHADLWAMALRCDLFRFGSLMFGSTGDNPSFAGEYAAIGQQNTFLNTNLTVHTDSIHGGDREVARLYQHWVQSNIVYFLNQLDDPQFLEANGNTVLDNSLVVIGTEYGWNHSLEDIFHAFAGAKGSFSPGWYSAPQLTADVMNAALTVFGVPATIGEKTNVQGRAEVAGLF
jgi:hypothetical protein